jgi:RNA polymerase sigma-70 factor (ECF subfamily)
MTLGEFEASVQAGSTRFYRVAKAILNHDADCEDAMQEAMVKAWLHLPQLKDPRLFETWLCRILINECKAQRRRWKHRAAAELIGALPDNAQPGLGLREAIHSMNLNLRIPLTLHHVNGFTVEETARIIHLPISTVKGRLRKGKQALALLLNQDGTEEDRR